MELFSTTLSQMAYLFTFIFLGYLLMKIRALPEGTAKVVSKLENNLLLPAMVFNTFANQFTAKTLTTAWRSILVSTALMVVMVIVALLSSRLFTKDGYLRKIYAYGLSFSNFGFMGYAVVKAIFPEFYMDYIIYTMPMWAGIYIWATPTLLMPEGQGGFKERLKNFLNPMFVCLVIGAVFGLGGLSCYIPEFAQNVINAAEGCMSPLAMMLVGITLADVKLKTVFTDFGVYAVSLVRLAAIPVIFVLAAKMIPFVRVDYVCALVTLSMPMGLSSIVIPAAYGNDTSKASGLALVSHAISCITIPLVFLWGC